jgi:peptidoglycan-N-acetylglucosamine deacetylase
MHKYFIKIPWWIPKLFSSYLWRVPTKKKVVYLTFDDGPHPSITPWVLAQLKAHQAKATFFCLGKNVVQFKEVYQQILDEGHSVGNHSFHHCNGWKTADEDYLADVAKASSVIHSNLFRPPYGRIRKKQAKGLSSAMQTATIKVVMWDILSADFDSSISPEQCAQNVLKNVRPGSVIVFHDSEKAYTNLSYSLPLVLSNLKNGGYSFEELIMDRF